MNHARESGRRLPESRIAARAAWVLGLVAAGCSQTGSSAGWTAVRDTVGDTVIVRTVGGSVWGAPARLIAILSIGEPDGADEYLFGRINSLAVSPDGIVYTFDSHVRALRAYAPDGRFLRRLGRLGGGPGEFRSPDAGLAVLPDGRVLLRDPGNARINVYAPDGTPLTSWRLPGGLSTSRPLFTDTAGHTYTRFLLDATARATDYTYGLHHYAPDGTVREPLIAPVWDYEPPTLVASRPFRERVSYRTMTVPFTPSASWTFSPHGYLVGGVSTGYTLDLFLAPGQVLRIERADWVPVRVLDDEAEERERWVTAFMRSFQPDWRWDGPSMPDAKPPFHDLLVGQDGRIWVRIPWEARRRDDAADLIRAADGDPLPPLTWTEPTVFDVFDPDGRYLGVVHAPPEFSMSPTPVIRGDTVVGVALGKWDVPRIVRYRVERGGNP